MGDKHPIYDGSSSERAGSSQNKYYVKTADCFNDLNKVIAIRSSVFMGEQDCPFAEEFDGNDFCATHFIGYLNDEPIACLRARYFADFVKLERLAVRHQYRRSRIAFMVVRAGIELARKKGYQLIYGHSQERLQHFWKHFGAKPIPGKKEFVFSDFSYREMVIELKPHPDPITIESDPYLIIRTEGTWHRLGVLDQSSERPATSPLRNRKAA